MHSGVPLRKAAATFLWKYVGLPVLAVFLLAATLTSFYGVNLTIRRHESIAQFAAFRLQGEITQLSRRLSSIGEDLEGKLPQEAAYLLNRALGEGFFDGLYLVDRNGAVILSMPSGSPLPSSFPTEGFSLARAPSGRTALYIGSRAGDGFLVATVSAYPLGTSIASELAPIYSGQLFLADGNGNRFPLFPPGLTEEALEADPQPLPGAGHQIYWAGGNILVRGVSPLDETGILLVARSSLLETAAPFWALGFASLLLGIPLWLLAVRVAYRHMESAVIGPLEVLMGEVEGLRKSRLQPELPDHLPGAAAEVNRLFSSFKEMASELTAAHAALVRSEKEKSLILEGVSDLVTLQDPELRIQWANRAAGDSVGKKPEELVGRRCHEIWHGRSSPCPGCPVVEALRTGSYQENEITTPDGRVWLIRARPLRDESGKIIGAVETTTEITRVRRAAEEQKALADISRALNAADVRKAFPTLAETLRHLLNCQRIVLLIHEEETRTFRITNLFSDPPVPELYDGLAYREGDSAAMESVLAGKMDCTTSLEEFSSFPAERALVQAGYRSRIVLPLRFGGRTIGALALLSTRPEPFWEGRLSFLQQVSEVLAMALARDQAYRSEREERFFNQILTETMALILKASSPEEFFDPILEKVAQAIPGDAFNLMLVIGDYAQVVSHRGYEKWGVEERMNWLHLPLSDYQSLRTVHEKGEPLLVPDTSSAPWWAEIPGFEWIKSYMCAPLRIGGEVVGFLNADGARPFQFTSRDLRRLQAFADHISLALERAKLLAELQDYSAQMERLVRERTEQLEARQAWLEAVFRGSSDGYILFNPQGEILEMNPIAWVWLHQATSPEEAESLRKTLKEMARNARSYPETTRELEAGDLHIKALPLEPGYPGALAILHEITHLKLLDRMRTKLITDISHELRTPLSALKLYGELIRMSPPEKRGIYIEQILHLIDQLAALVDDIIEIARLETGRVELRLSPVELNEFVGKALEKHRLEAQKRGHRLEFLPSPDNPTVMADSSRLEQILDNLLSNAIRYTPDGGRITVSVGVSEEDGRLWGVMEVADNGIGIPEDELPHIFERFYRGESARSSQVPGTGLGLAIVKELVDLHKGKIKVKSKVGEGTTFTVMLPLLLPSG